MKRPRILLATVATLALLTAWLGPNLRPAQGFNFVVNSTADTNDGACDAAPNCTLREAINAANALFGPDIITFAILAADPGCVAGVCKISVLTDLPAITDTVTIDGWSQGGGGYLGPPLIHIDGSAPTTVNGLVIDQADGVVVRGLSITAFDNVPFTSHGILMMNSAQQAWLYGNYIGLTPAGSNAGNFTGILVCATCAQVRIGTNLDGSNDAAERNVISANIGEGISINGSSSTVVAGNYVGTDLTGTAARGNGAHGVFVQGPNNVIGGTTASARNVVSGNGQVGVLLFGANATNNVVQGNYIGTNAAGIGAIPNTNEGVSITDAPGNLIGGTVGTTAGGPCTGACNVISGNTTNGIFVGDPRAVGAIGNRVQGNYIGLNAAGTTSLPNQRHGVDVDLGASGTGIGGTTAAARNLISGNGQNGVWLGATTTSTTVQGNYIGTDVTGTLDRGNALDGVHIEGPNNIVGGTTAGTRNVIAGNDNHGVRILGVGATGNVVLGNYIGTDVGGSAGLGNGLNGVRMLTVFGNTIGGSVAGSGNLISGNTGDGIGIEGGGTHLVQGNFVGTNAAGTGPLANGVRGIFLVRSANNTIGGTTAGARNVASGNTSHGVDLFDSPSNRVQGNYIGTDAAGTSALGNGGLAGLLVNQSANNLIGGTSSGEGNLISGNPRGVYIANNSSGNQVHGNRIGTNVLGTTGLPNANEGVFVESSSNNLIGGTTAGAANTIAFNGGDGVAVTFNPGNAIQRNAIFENLGLGIELGIDNAVTPNDAGDPDTGANNRQNFPVLTAATSNGGTTTVSGTLNSTATTSFTVEFLANTACDPSGFGEGERFLGSTGIVTDAGGNAGFNVNFSPAVPLGQYITTTATSSPGNDTSEFSACLLVTQFLTPTPTSTATTTPTNTATATSTATATPTSTQTATSTTTSGPPRSSDTPFPDSTASRTSTATPSPSGSATGTTTPGATRTPTATSTPTASPTITGTTTSTATVIATSTATRTPTATATVATSTATATVSPTVAPSATRRPGRNSPTPVR